MKNKEKMYIFTITLKHGRHWQGASSNEETAKNIACACFLAPLSSILNIEARRVLI